MARLFYNGDDTIAVFDVDLSGTDPRHFGGMSGRGQRLRYLHPDKDWPDGDYLQTLRVHSGSVLAGSPRGIVVTAPLAELLGKMKGLRRMCCEVLGEIEQPESDRATRETDLMTG